MYKILITGGAGFIGFHLSKKLAESHKVIMIDNLARGRMDEDLENLIENPNFTFIQADLTDPRAYLTLDKDFDFIYHLAAIIGVKNVSENPDRVLYVNAISNLLLFEFAQNMPNLKKIFFSSTSEIYSGTMKNFGIDVPTNEEVKLTITDIKSPRATYALSKMYGESICFNYHAKYNIPFTIGRYHNVYGPRMGFSHVVPEMFIKISNSTMVDVPSPTHTRAMCYIDDAVEMTIRACENENTNTEILNIGNQDQEIEVVKLVKTIAKIMKREITTNELPDTPGSPARRCPDISKVVQFTHFTPKVGLEEGIEKTYSWYKNKLSNKYE